MLSVMCASCSRNKATSWSSLVGMGTKGVVGEDGAD